MSYNTWQDGTVELRPDGTPFPSYAPNITLQVHANGGSVTVQALNSSATWAALAEYTITDDALRILQVAASPPLRVVASGGAKFLLTRG